MIQNSVLEAMRLRHWMKSGFCIVALFFCGQASDWGAICRVVPVVVCFSLISSGGYLVNDVWNRKEDANHPKKKFRAIAEGRLGVQMALVVASILYGVGMIGAYLAYPDDEVLGIILLYVSLSLSYTFYLRSLFVVDILVISLGFVLRVYAGAVAIAVDPSIWLLSVTYLLALLLGVGKRVGECKHLREGRMKQGGGRQVLTGYSGMWGRGGVVLVSSGLLLVYAGYAVVVHGGCYLVTLIPVVVGVGRYVTLVLYKGIGEEPELLVWKDKMILGALFVWGGISAILLYR